jgi:hypothetical protein
MKRNILIFLFVILALVLAACGGSGTPSDSGKELFAQTTIGDQPGCITCHSLEPGVIIIGPVCRRISAAIDRGSECFPGPRISERHHASRMGSTAE